MGTIKKPIKQTFYIAYKSSIDESTKRVYVEGTSVTEAIKSLKLQRNDYGSLIDVFSRYEGLDT